MKGSKSILLVAVIAAVLILGIAYAAVSANFTVNGTASAAPNTDNFKVSFVTIAEKTEEQGKATLKYSASGNTADFTISGLSTEGEEVSIEYTIQNQSSDIDAILSAVTVSNSNEEYFEVTATNLKDVRVKAGQTTTLTITVRLIKNVAIDVSTTIGATFTAVSAEPVSA